jgi:hypothetical protein
VSFSPHSTTIILLKDAHGYVPGSLALAEKQLLADPAALQPSKLSRIFNQQKGIRIQCNNFHIDY